MIPADICINNTIQININMRCIEITSSTVFEDGFAEININMRCIEILQT